MRDELLTLEEKLIPGNGGLTPEDCKVMLEAWRNDRDTAEEVCRILGDLEEELQDIRNRLDKYKELNKTKTNIFKKKIGNVLQTLKD